jgi:hypothetical protein
MDLGDGSNGSKGDCDPNGGGGGDLVSIEENNGTVV